MTGTKETKRPRPLSLGMWPCAKQKWRDGKMESPTKVSLQARLLAWRRMLNSSEPVEAPIVESPIVAIAGTVVKVCL